MSSQGATKTFKYEGMGRDGKKVTGECDAIDVETVRRQLRRDGIKVTKLQAPSLFDVDLNYMLLSMMGAKAFGKKDLARFTGQLATLMDAGVPILQSLEMLYKQEKSLGLKRALKGVAKSVNEGKSLQDALVSSKNFDKLYCYMIKAGESAGILDQILVRLSTFLEKQIALKKKVQSAMTYPAIIVVVGSAVIFFLLAFVVPQFVDMIKESNQEIPWITQFVMDISDFIATYWMAMIVGIFSLLGALMMIIRTPQGKASFDQLMLKMPLFKELVIKSNLSGFTQTLSTLIGAGIPILDALDISIDTLDNGLIAKDLTKVKLAVASGKNMSDPLKRIAYFPALVAQMIQVGENTGKLDTMLNKVAKVLEFELEAAIGILTQLIEPIILVILGGTIAVVMLAMYMPIFMSAGAGV